jgi:hypothetical protein
MKLLKPGSLILRRILQSSLYSADLMPLHRLKKSWLEVFYNGIKLSASFRQTVIILMTRQEAGKFLRIHKTWKEFDDNRAFQWIEDDFSQPKKSKYMKYPEM